jgi:hypothetical protein
MGLMDRLFGKPAKKPSASAQRAGPASQQLGGPSTRGGSNSPQTIRKELVRVSVRDTLLHHGIPASWMRADPLTTSAPGRETGVHVRLVVQHWDSRLLQHAVALQEHVEKRILSLDPDAERWLMGLSWQFDLKDTSRCPAMPHPGSWTAPDVDTQRAPAPADRAPQAAPAGADVISGPTRIQSTGEDKRKALERMLGERDADFRAEGNGFSRTQPMGFEKTQPMGGFDKSAPAPLAPGGDKPRTPSGQ